MKKLFIELTKTDPGYLKACEAFFTGKPIRVRLRDVRSIRNVEVTVTVNA